MDEPLSNLDAKLRVQMRSEVARIQHELSATTVYVTHDQVEAMTMGDRVALMRRGILQQVDTPMNLYNSPANLFVASFIGSPSMNLFEAQLEQRNGHLVAQIGDQFLRLRPGLEQYAGRKLALGIRPEHIEDAAVETGAPADRRLRAVVKNVEALGAELIAHLELAGKPVLSEEVKEIAADLDDTMLSELEAEADEHKLPLVGRFDVASRAQVDQPIEIVVDTDHIHYFDLDSGEAIR
jgi:multiple sugar transport system ATP-binding protein